MVGTPCRWGRRGTVVVPMAWHVRSVWASVVHVVVGRPVCGAVCLRRPRRSVVAVVFVVVVFIVFLEILSFVAAMFVGAFFFVLHAVVLLLRVSSPGHGAGGTQGSA